MPLPPTPPITAQDINVELNRAPTAPFSIIGAEERALAGVPSGAISFTDFLGKSAATVTLSATSFINGTEYPGGTGLNVEHSVFSGTAAAELLFSDNGRLYAATNAGWVQISSSTDWIIPHDLPDLSPYEVRLTETSGFTDSGGTGVSNLGDWQSLDTGRIYEVRQIGASGQARATYSNGTIDIRRSGNIVASIGYSLFAEVDNSD
jgi:hypothetical protein